MYECFCAPISVFSTTVQFISPYRSAKRKVFLDLFFSKQNKIFQLSLLISKFSPVFRACYSINDVINVLDKNTIKGKLPSL